MNVGELPGRAALRPAIARLGRRCSLEFALGVGDAVHHVVVREGVVADVLQGPFKMRPAAFSISAPEAAWAEFCKPVPKPGFHDIFAMSATGNGRIEGDVRRLLEHLEFVKCLLAALREEAPSHASA